VGPLHSARLQKGCLVNAMNGQYELLTGWLAAAAAAAAPLPELTAPPACPSVWEWSSPVTRTQ
jgi:hypothetical protein